MSRTSRMDEWIVFGLLAVCGWCVPAAAQPGAATVVEAPHERPWAAPRLAPRPPRPDEPVVEADLEGHLDGDLDNDLDSDLGDDAPLGGLPPDLGELDALLEADLNQLSHTDVVVPIFSEEVTTVTRQESSVGRSPAAVYVITGEMIRRSGARSIPEALRLAPGVQVARINSGKWAVSIRGFNDRFANKLLVQIDGRTVYTPLFAGVFWDVQDVLLEDIERIEVIRGPGATVWGANAVNGVINIITKQAGETQGAFAEAGSGNLRNFASVRYGGQSGDTAWRVYGKWFDRDEGLLPNGEADDDWRMGRGGFRLDWRPSCCDLVTFQGDYYDGTAGQTQFSPLPGPPFVLVSPEDQQVAGGNVLFRWTRELSERSDWSLQMFYDRTERSFDVIGFREDRATVDVDFQHRFGLGEWHSIIWGLGYRNTRDRIRNGFSLRFLPDSRADDRFSTFAQDEMTLWEDRLFFTLGSKFSWNDYTGFEIQPTARLLYTPSHRQSIWASVSRAVRVPSRANDDVLGISIPTAVPVFPTYPTILGNRDIESEQLLAWEFGMRAAPTDTFFWDLAVFYNQYTDLHTISPRLPGIDPVTLLFSQPLVFINGADADSYGFELASNWKVNERWNLRGAYSFLYIDMQPSPQAFSGATSVEGQSPRNQFFLHSSWDVGWNWEFDLIGRYTDNLSAIGIPRYFEMDARLAWQATDTFEFAVVGRNLLDRAHPEYGDDVFGGVLATEVRRELYGIVSWRY